MASLLARVLTNPSQRVCAATGSRALHPSGRSRRIDLAQIDPIELGTHPLDDEVLSDEARRRDGACNQDSGRGPQAPAQPEREVHRAEQVDEVQPAVGGPGEGINRWLIGRIGIVEHGVTNDEPQR